MDWDFLLAWQNIAFLVPLGLSLLLLALSVAGLSLGALSEGISEGASEGVSEGASESLLGAVLGFFYAGRVSLSVTLFVFAISFASFGVGSNWHFSTRPEAAGTGILAVDATMVLVSLSIALAGALVVTKAVTSLLSRYLPLSETYAADKPALVGCSGLVDSADVTPDKGRALVTSAHGVQVTVDVRTEAGVPPIPKGARVVVRAFDAQSGLFLVSADSPQPPPAAVS